MADKEDEFEGDDGPWPWEEAAESMVRGAIATMEMDEDAGVVRMFIDGSVQEFEDFEGLREALISEAESELVSRMPFEDGAPVFSSDADGMVDDILFEAKIEDFFGSGNPTPDQNQLLLTFDGLVAANGHEQIRIDVESINEELIRHLARHPEQMRFDPAEVRRTCG